MLRYWIYQDFNYMDRLCVKSIIVTAAVEAQVQLGGED